MRFYTARQVIHDAFMWDVTSIDISALLLDFGIQFSAKGSENRIMDHCDKGVIQQAMQVQRRQDLSAWAWNMFAYTPPGTAHGYERSTLLQWLVSRYRGQGCGNPLRDPKIGTMMLARVAMEDIKYEDVLGRRKRRKYADMASLVGVGEDEYKKHWHWRYAKFRGYCQALPERSLPPIANIVWMIIDKRSENPKQAETAREDLVRALKINSRGMI